MLVPLALVGGVGLTATLFAVWLGTGGGSRWLAGQLENAVEARTRGGSFVIESFEPGLFSWNVGGISLWDAEGRALLVVDRAELRTNPWALLRGRVHVPSATVTGVHVSARRNADGTTDWGSLFVPSGSTEPTSTPVDIFVNALAVDGLDVTFETPEGTALAVSDGWLYGRVVAHRTTFDLSELEAGASLDTPGPIPIGLWGGAQWDTVGGGLLRDLEVQVGDSSVSATGTVGGGNTNLAVVVDALHGADVGTLLGRPLTGTWTGALTAKGPPEDFQVVGGFGSPTAGALVVLAHVDVTGDAPRWWATGDLDGLRIEAIDPSITQPVVLDGLVRAEGTGATPATLDASGSWRARDVVLYGQRADTVDARFRLHDGTVELAPSQLDGILGQMTVSGSYGLTTGALDVGVESDLSPARLAALGTTGLTGDGRISARVLRGAGEPGVRVVGTARYAPFVYGPDVRVGVLRAPFDVTVEAGETRGTFDLAGSRVAAYGAVASSVTGTGLRLRRSADGRIEVGGAVSTPDAAYDRYFHATRADTTFRFEQAGAHRRVTANTTIGPHDVVGLPAGGGVVSTTVDDTRVRAEVHFGTGVRATLDTVARYELSTGALQLDTLTFAPTPRTTWTAVEPVTLTVVEGGMADGRIHLQSTLGEVEVRGDLGTTGVLDGRIALTGFELDHVTELWPDDWDLGGRLDLVADLSGDAAAPTVDARVDLTRLFANGSVRWLDVDGDVHLDGGVLRPDLAMASAGAPLARLTGAVPLTGGLSAPALALDDPAVVSLAVVPGALSRLRTVFPSLDDTELPTGVVSASIDATGPLRDPDVRMAGITEVSLPGFVAPARTEFEVRRDGGLLAFDADVREDFLLRARVSGKGDTRASEVFAWLHGTGPEVDLASPSLWVDDLSTRLILVGMPTDGLAALAGSPVSVTGELLGGFVISGSPTRPVVEGGLNWVDASVGGQPFDGGYFALVPAEAGGYTMDLVAALPDDGGIEVHGALPLLVDLTQDFATWTTAPLALTVSGAGLPVSLVGAVLPDVRGIEGLLTVSGTVGGTLDHPLPELDLRGEGLGLQYRPLVLATEGARVEAHVSPTLVTFDARVPTLPARTFTKVDLEPGAEPRIRVVGTVGLKDWTPTVLDAKVHFHDGAWVSATDLTRIRTTGDLRVDGTWPAVQVRGELELVQGRVGIEAAGFVDASPLTLAPTLAVVRASVPAAPPVVVDEADSFTLEGVVDVDLGRNLQFELSMPFVDQLGGLGAAVSRVDLSTRLGGNVKVRSSAGDPAPTLVGELELVDGTVRVMRSTFDLQEGHITFAGGDPYENAELDVSARMAVSGASLDLNITGTPVEPEFQIVSEEYPDPTEQMVILVTGTAPEELTADQGAGAALSLLWSSAFAGMRLGSFSIEPSGAVKLGIPVSRRIYTSTTWAMSQDPTVNQLTFEADWSLSRHVVVNGAVGDRQSWGDLYWEVRF